MQQDPYGDAESLFRAFYQGVVRVAYSLAGSKTDAEDIAQQSFCKILAVWTRILYIGLYAAGYEYEEIAAWLGISISAVRSHMSYPRRQPSGTVARERKVARG